MVSLEERITGLERTLAVADKKINALTNTMIEMINSLKGLADSSRCKENYCIVFFLGSGASVPAGMPSMEDVTNTLVAPEHYKYANLPNHQADHTIQYLNALKNEINCYYKCLISDRKANYEDIFFMAEQLRDIKSFGNPAIAPLFRKLENLPDIEKSIRDNGIFCLASNTMSLIRTAVVFKLWNKPNSDRTRYLSFLKDAFEDPNINKINIVTLNHDKVLDTYFDANGISYVDGFNTEKNGVRLLDRRLFENNDKITCVKLHGAVNLFKFSTDKNSLTPGLFMGDSLPILCSDNADIYKFEEERIKCFSEGSSLLLIGQNKTIAYANDIFSILWHQFYLSLEQSTLLIVIGYGFGDFGVNIRILEWLNSSSKNKLLIVDPGSNEEIQNNILENSDQKSRNFVEYVENKKVMHIRKSITETSWAEIKSYLEID